jgi:hypothetical protein
MARPRITLTFVVAGLASGCALTGTNVPPLTGPSELGLSLSLAATPDVLVQDGISRSRVSLTARDPNSRPVRGLAVTVDVEGDDLAADSGRLSHRTVTTNVDGQGSVIYIAPRAAVGTAAVARTVAVVVTPVGTDFANAAPRSVLIRLVPPSAIP